MHVRDIATVFVFSSDTVISRLLILAMGLQAGEAPGQLQFYQAQGRRRRPTLLALKGESSLYLNPVF